MNANDKTAFTTFTEIAEAKRPNVRKMQAEMMRSMLRALCAPLRKVVKRTPQHVELQVLDQS